MNRRDEKQRAWDEWHAGYYFHDIPMMTPPFEYGFDSAWDAMLAKLRLILEQIRVAYEENDLKQLRIISSQIRDLIDEPR